MGIWRERGSALRSLFLTLLLPRAPVCSVGQICRSGCRVSSMAVLIVGMVSGVSLYFDEAARLAMAQGGESSFALRGKNTLPSTGPSQEDAAVAKSFASPPSVSDRPASKTGLQRQAMGNESRSTVTPGRTKRRTTLRVARKLTGRSQKKVPRHLGKVHRHSGSAQRRKKVPPPPSDLGDAL